MGESGVVEGAGEGRNERVECFTVNLLSRVYVAKINVIIDHEKITSISRRLEKENVLIIALDKFVDPCRVAQATLYVLEAISDVRRNIRRPSLLLLSYVLGVDQIKKAVDYIKRRNIRLIYLAALSEEYCLSGIEAVGEGKREVIIRESSCRPESLFDMALLHLEITR